LKNKVIVKPEKKFSELMCQCNISNMKKIFSYVFSIPCSNAHVESIFSNMKHLWSDYRNRMDIDLVAPELEIHMNGSLSCEDFYDFILSQKDLLNKIRTNENFDKKKRIPDE